MPRNEPIDAFVYAAGRGARLGARYAARQKLMLEFGGRSLLEWHALRLAAAGVQRMTVVTGFGREAVAAALPDIGRRHGIAVRELVNPHFEEGSVLSVAATLPDIERGGGGLLLDGDVLYPGGFLERLLAGGGDSVLLVDRAYEAADDDPVLVPLRDGRPFEFRKRWRGEAEAVGESVGLFRIVGRDVPTLAAETRARLRGAERGESYDELLRALVLDGRMTAADVSGEPWTEIDFPGDVRRAREVVMPAILARR